MSRQRPTTRASQEEPSSSAPAGPGSSQVDNEPQAPAGNGNPKRDSNVKMPTFLGKFGAIELENKGSVARDHLALERTFLAWLRTSLAFASIGIAITQLFRLNSVLQTPGNGSNPLAHLGKSLGATFVGISIIVLALGAQRYYESQEWLLKGKFPASRGSIFATALIAILLIIASLVIVLIARPDTPEL